MSYFSTLQKIDSDEGAKIGVKKTAGKSDLVSPVNIQTVRQITGSFLLWTIGVAMQAGLDKPA